MSLKARFVSGLRRPVFAERGTHRRDTKISRYWVFASDPAVYHWDTLFVKGKELWSNIRSAKAQRYLKQVRKGDHAICYHGPPARVLYALAQVASDPYPNPHAPAGNLLVVDLKADQVLPRPVLYKELKLNRALRKMKLLAEPRLPLSPVSEEIYHEILRMAGLPAVPMLR